MDHRLCKSVACAENEPPTGMHPCIDHSFPASRMRLLFSILNWIVFVICVCVMNQNFVEFALPALSSFFKSRLTDHKISFIRHLFLLDKHPLAFDRCFLMCVGSTLLNWSLQSDLTLLR